MGMTIDEAIKILKGGNNRECTWPEYSEAIFEIGYNKGFIDGNKTKPLDREVEQEDILDKLRTEIKALSPEPTAYDVVDGNPVKDAIWETLIEVDKIIDKYKAESEDKE